MAFAGGYPNSGYYACEGVVIDSGVGTWLDWNGNTAGLRSDRFWAYVSGANRFEVWSDSVKALVPISALSTTTYQLELIHTASTKYARFTVDTNSDLTVAFAGQKLAMGGAIGGTYSTNVGASSIGSGDYGSAFGAQSKAEGRDSCAFGVGAQASGSYTIAIGYGAIASNMLGVAFGYNASSTGAQALAFGCQATANIDNVAVFGSEDYPVNAIFGGKGLSSTTPSGWGISGTRGSGSNCVGGDLYLDTGAGTGNAATGVGYLRAWAAEVSGSTLQTTAVNVLSWTRDGIALPGPTVPGSSGATGRVGQISWDANYLYVCTAANTWKRAALSTW